VHLSANAQGIGTEAPHFTYFSKFGVSIYLLDGNGLVSGLPQITGEHQSREIRLL
jgi:hypothetical protein